MIKNCLLKDSGSRYFVCTLYYVSILFQKKKLWLLVLHQLAELQNHFLIIMICHKKT